MTLDQLALTYIGGPTILLEWGGLRLLTDPTFDPAGSVFPHGAYTLAKTQAPALDATNVGPIDLVLLSHDHHSDNLDRSGRALLHRARHVLTTTEAAARLGEYATGLSPWSRWQTETPNAAVITIHATPARHGPEGGDRGPVTGFALSLSSAPGEIVYISGDTVWYDGVAEVAGRFTPTVALLFMGAARVSVAGPEPLTLTAKEAIIAAQEFDAAQIVPVHYEGWQHFTESRRDIESAFDEAGLSARLVWLDRGHRTLLPLRQAIETGRPGI